MKNILLIVHDDENQESRYQIALDLARSLDGHLTCMDVILDPAPMGFGCYEDAAVLVELARREADQEGANKQRLQARLCHEDVNWEWVDVLGGREADIRRHIGCADVIVIGAGQSSGGSTDWRHLTGGLIAHARRPVLAVPDVCSRLSLDHALLAWNGSDAAVEAMQVATPILQRACRTTILQVGHASPAQPAEEAALYLSRHGIHAAIERGQPLSRADPEAVIDEIRRRRPSLVVMNGYGRARVAEALFGGVTRLMLDRLTVPVLFAH